MKKVGVLLIMIFSLVVSTAMAADVWQFVPASSAQAVEFGCQSGKCQASEKIEKQNDNKKQTDDRHANAGQHCCCAHVASDRLYNKADGFSSPSSEVFEMEEDDVPTSVVFGPPLKPPSRA